LMSKLKLPAQVDVIEHLKFQPKDDPIIASPTD
jgi:hypothetical protein